MRGRRDGSRGETGGAGFVALRSRYRGEEVGGRGAGESVGVVQLVHNVPE